ncbi:retrovirus-related pol polyprotein from transposon TNT 1-94 [Tanacetum coccineum]
MATSDPLTLVAEKTKVSKHKEKVVVQSESEGSDDKDISDLKKITALLAKAFNRKKYYDKPTNNNLRTSSLANKKPEYGKLEEKKEDKKADEKKQDMSKVKCYNCKKEGHFAKDCKKKTKDQAWMESSSDSYQEIKANMVFMAKMEKIISDSEESSSSAEETITEVTYYSSDSESESEYETSEYYDYSTNYGLFVDNDDDQEIFHDALEYASENFNENHIVSQKDHDESEFDHNDFEEKDHLFDKLVKKFNQKVAKCQKCIEKANQKRKDLENQKKDLQDKYDVLKNQVNTFEEKNNEFNEQIKVLNEKNNDLLAQAEVLQEQPKVKQVVIDNHIECQAQYAKLEEERYQYMIRYSALYLDTLISVRRPKHSGVIWKKKGSYNTSNVELSSVSNLKLNKDVKRYSHKDLLSCNNSHHVDTRSAYVCNDAMNVSCNSRLYASYDVNDLFVFDDIVQICLWIINSGCSKHMTGNRALLTNLVEKFLGTVHFGNNDFAKGPEVAFRKSTCFVRNEDGVDLLTGDRSPNLYIIALNEIASNLPACLLAKASSSQSWLWHQRLSHLNLATIQYYVKSNLVRGLPKMKFEKDHLCSACEQGKIHRKHHKSKTAFASNNLLYLLHMDLCGPMRVECINGKRYVLVVVDDYSRYTWVFFLHSKDEASEMASKQFNLEPGLSNLNETGKSSNPSISKVLESSKKDLEDLFQNFYDEYFDASKITKTLTTNVETSNDEIPSHEEEVFHKSSESFQEESSSSSLNADVQQSLDD